MKKVSFNDNMKTDDNHEDDTRTDLNRCHATTNTVYADVCTIHIEIFRTNIAPTLLPAMVVAVYKTRPATIKQKKLMRYNEIGG